jgi:hypothetical protein
MPKARSLAPNAQSLYGFFLMGIFEDEDEYEEEDEEEGVGLRVRGCFCG